MEEEVIIIRLMVHCIVVKYLDTCEWKRNHCIMSCQGFGHLVMEDWVTVYIVRYPDFGHMVMHFVVVSRYRTNGYGRGVHCIVFFKNLDACDHCIVMCPDLGWGSLYSCCQVFGHW